MSSLNARNVFHYDLRFSFEDFQEENLVEKRSWTEVNRQTQPYILLGGNEEYLKKRLSLNN